MKVRRIVTLIAATVVPSIGWAYTISTSSPLPQSSWQAGASLTVLGTITWIVDTRNMMRPIMEPRPDSCIVYVHAGGANGTMTNSANATLSVTTDPDGQNTTTGVETYSASLELKPKNPPIGGGNGNNASYVIEALPFALGQPILLQGGDVLRALTIILVAGG